MRKLMTAATVAVMALGLGTACQDSRNKAQEARADLAQAEQQAQQEMTQTQQKLSEETARVRQDAAAQTADARARASEDMQAAQDQLAQKREQTAQELREAKGDAAREEQEATGGAGMTGTTGTRATTAATMNMTGTLASSTGRQLTVMDAKGAELKLDVDDQTQVMHDGQKVDIDDFDEGTRLSATYEVQGDKKLARKVTVTAPAAKK